MAEGVLKKIEFSVVFVGWSERIGLDTPLQISSDIWRVERPTGNGCGHPRLRGSNATPAGNGTSTFEPLALIPVS